MKFSCKIHEINKSDSNSIWLNYMWIVPVEGRSLIDRKAKVFTSICLKRAFFHISFSWNNPLTWTCDGLYFRQEVHQDQGESVQVDVRLKRALTHQLYDAVYVALTLQREIGGPGHRGCNIKTCCRLQQPEIRVSGWPSIGLKSYHFKPFQILMVL